MAAPSTTLSSTTPPVTLPGCSRQSRPSGPLDRPRGGQHLTHWLLCHQRAERVGVHRHAPRQVLAGQVEVEHRHPQRVLLHGEGLVGERLDLNRAFAEVRVLVDDDPREGVLSHDQLAAQVAEADSLLPHDSTPLSERRTLGSTLPETCSFVKRVFYSENTIRNYSRSSAWSVVLAHEIAHPPRLADLAARRHLVDVRLDVEHGGSVQGVQAAHGQLEAVDGEQFAARDAEVVRPP